MSTLQILGFATVFVALLAGGWLGWQLLRQNGRILLRLDELEKRLNEMEFGGQDEPEGLPVGTEAPTFELPDLAGGRQSLTQFRGQPVLMVFFNPECGFCRELVPKLAALPTRSSRREEVDSLGPESGIRNQNSADHLLTSAATPELPRILLVTTGDPEKNRQFFTEHKVACPVLMQNDGEVANAYQVNGTPAGYLVSAEGKIASELAMGAEALLELASQPATLTPALSPSEGEKENAGNGSDGRANRFSQRSVARSKIKRDGLKAGTPAPDFRMPRVDGRGELGLKELRGRRVLLVFSDPHCGPCNTLAPELEEFHREQARREVGRVTPCAPQGDGGFKNGAHGVTRPTLGITVIMISRGEPKENRAKIKEHGLTFPVVLQQQWEISRRYAMFSTPVAYLIDEAGIIAKDVAVGVVSILALLNHTDQKAVETEQAVR